MEVKRPFGKAKERHNYDEQLKRESTIRKMEKEGYPKDIVESAIWRIDWEKQKSAGDNWEKREKMIEEAKKQIKVAQGDLTKEK